MINSVNPKFNKLKHFAEILADLLRIFEKTRALALVYEIKPPWSYRSGDGRIVPESQRMCLLNPTEIVRIEPANTVLVYEC